MGRFRQWLPVQDTLDSIEFIAGPPDSEWGAVRVRMGRPQPWNLTYIAVGNEACMLRVPSALQFCQRPHLDGDEQA